MQDKLKDMDEKMQGFKEYYALCKNWKGDDDEFFQMLEKTDFDPIQQR